MPRRSTGLLLGLNIIAILSLMACAQKPAPIPSSAPTAEKVIPLAFQNPDGNGTPKGWSRTLDEGTVQASVQDQELRIKTQKASVRYEHSLDVGNPSRLELDWDWKVDQFPANPDFAPWNGGGRKRPLQSNSLQVLAIFRDGLTVYVIHYLWEPDVEVGYTWHETETEAVVVTLKYVRAVVRSGPDKTPAWHSESRDLIKDFQTFFPGKPVPPLIRVAVRVSSRFADGATAASDESVRNVRVKYE